MKYIKILKHDTSSSLYISMGKIKGSDYTYRIEYEDLPTSGVSNYSSCTIVPCNAETYPLISYIYIYPL